MCRAHIAALRAIPCFLHATIVVIPEENLGNEAQEIADVLIDIRGVAIMCAFPDIYGVKTKKYSGTYYTMRFQKKLAERAVSFHHRLAVGNPFWQNMSAEQRVAKARNTFEAQLTAFRRIFLVPKSVLSSVQMTYTGKADRNNQRSTRSRDDLCMACLFGIYYAAEYVIRTPGLHLRGYSDKLTFVMPAAVTPLHKVRRLE